MPASNRRSRNLFIVAFWAFALVTAGLDGLLACPSCGLFGRRRARKRANRRACFANQKTIAGAIEMYNLDFNTQLEGLEPAMLGKLKEAGYLQSVPNDPGEGEGTSGNYVQAKGEVLCLRHGYIQPPTGFYQKPCREQLIAAGVTDADLLKRASTKDPSRGGSTGVEPWGGFFSMGLLYTINLFWFPLCFFRLLGFRSGRQKIFGLFMVGTFVAYGVGGAYAMAAVFYLGFLTLGLDLFIFSIQLIFSKGLLGLLSTCKGAFSRLGPHSHKARQEQLDKDLRRYRIGIAVEVLLLVLVVTPGAGWLVRHGRQLYGAIGSGVAGLLMILLVGVFSAVPLFCNMAQRRKNGPSPYGRLQHGIGWGAVTILIGMPVINHGQFLLAEGSSAWANMGIPGAYLIGFFLFRHLMTANLLRRLRDELASLGPSAPRKVHRPQGRTARPSRPVDGAARPAGGKSREQGGLELLLLPEARIALSDALCPVCGEGFSSKRVTLCTGCGTPHHEECWDFGGRCAIFGCNRRQGLRHESKTVRHACG